MSGPDESQLGTFAQYLDDYPDVDQHSCQLLGPTALVSLYSVKQAGSNLFRVDRARSNGNPCNSLSGI
jgi:hypothetical protein